MWRLLSSEIKRSRVREGENAKRVRWCVESSIFISSISSENTRRGACVCQCKGVCECTSLEQKLRGRERMKEPHRLEEERSIFFGVEDADAGGPEDVGDGRSVAREGIGVGE